MFQRGEILPAFLLSSGGAISNPGLFALCENQPEASDTSDSPACRKPDLSLCTERAHRLNTHSSPPYPLCNGTFGQQRSATLSLRGWRFRTWEPLTARTWPACGCSAPKRTDHLLCLRPPADAAPYCRCFPSFISFGGEAFPGASALVSLSAKGPPPHGSVGNMPPVVLFSLLSGFTWCRKEMCE